MSYNKLLLLLMAALASVLVLSCTESLPIVDAPYIPENKDETDTTIPDMSDTPEGYFISIEGTENSKDVLSRNYWEELENESLAFWWEDSTDDMKAFVFNQETMMDFVDGRKYSSAIITKNLDDRKKCYMNIVSGLKTEYQDGYVIWGVCPATDENISGDGVVSFSMPEHFTFSTEQESPTEHLRKYLFMSGMGKVSDQKAIILFDVLPTIFRFRVKNTDTETLRIKSVSLTGAFNDKAELKYDASSEQLVDRAYYSSNKDHTIKVLCNGDVEINPEEFDLIYALVFPTKDLPETNITLNLESNFGRKVSTATFKNIFKNTTELKPNTYYTLPVIASRLGIEIGNTTIEDFIPGDTCNINFDKKLN